jgi:hypothetical protein
MRSAFLAAALIGLALGAQPARAADKLDLKVLYAGNPGSARAKNFVSFLNGHFAKVGETSYERFTPDEAKDYDVVIFDWTSIYPRDENGKLDSKRTGIGMPRRPNVSADFDRPAILVGAAGGTLSQGLPIKIDWL